MSSHTPERHPFGPPHRESPSEAAPPSDESEPKAAEEPSRGALFDGSFRERLRARRSGPQAPEPGQDEEPPPQEQSEDQREREGLPPGFRMRHDRHYVEELSSPAQNAPLRYLDISRLRARQPLHQNEGLGALIASVRELGLVQPLVVRPHGRDFEVVAGAKRLAAASAAGLRTVPCIVQELDDQRAERYAEAARVRGDSPQSASEAQATEAQATGSRTTPAVTHPSLSANAIEEIEKSLRSIVSSVEMMRSAPGALLERAARDLMAAEAHRCDWLVRASRRLQETAGTEARGVVDLQAVVERQIALLEPESRLLGVETQLTLPEPLFVRAVESDLAMAIEGVLRSLLACLAESRGGVLRVELVREGGSVAVLAHQNLHTLSAELADRFFDADFSDRPGGFAAATGLACARLVFQDFGGVLQLLRTSSAGPLQGFGVLGRLPLQA